MVTIAKRHMEQIDQRDHKVQIRTKGTQNKLNPKSNDSTKKHGNESREGAWNT